MHTATKRRRNTGFTLIELLVTLAIAVILLLITTFGLGELIAKNRMTTAVNSFIASLQLARSEAITRGGAVRLCPSSNGSSCLDSTEWHRGYIVHQGAEVIRYTQGEAGAPVSISSPVSGKTITYQAEGTAPSSNNTYTFCDAGDTVDPRAVIISNTGRPRTSHKKPDGSALDCS